MGQFKFKARKLKFGMKQDLTVPYHHSIFINSITLHMAFKQQKIFHCPILGHFSFPIRDSFLLFLLDKKPSEGRRALIFSQCCRTNLVTPYL